MSQTKAQLISDLVQSLNFTGTSSAPANGMYLSAANTIKLATNSNGRLTIDSSGNATFTGTCTATTFIGALTGTASGNATLTGSTDNTICTVTGANAIQGEANLTFNGTSLKVGNNFSPHSEGDDLVIGGSGWRGMTIYGEGGGGVIQFADDGDTRAGQLVYDHGANAMSFRVGGNVTRLTLDSTARLGIGVTPYASNVGSLSLVGGTNFWSSAPNNTYWGANTYYNGSAWKYIADGITSVLRMENGVLKFHNSATGSADGNVTLNERLRIDSSGRLLITSTTSRTVWGANPQLQIEKLDSNAAITVIRNQNNAGGPWLALCKSRGTSNGAVTIVQDGDSLGSINWFGADGVDLASTSAEIRAEIDGTPGSNDLPGRIIFKTTADGASSATERLRITNNGRLLINTTDNSGYSNRSAYFCNPNDPWNYISLTGATNGGAGIVFGDGTGQSAANYESYLYHNNTDDNFYIAFDQGNKSMKLVKATGDLELSNGNLKVPDGKGIDFSATSDGAGSTNELLDDYEDGAFTPNWDAPDQAGATFVHSHAYGYYTKIGNVVTVTIYVQGYCNGNAGGGANDNLKIVGLPFAPATIPGGGSSNRHAANFAIGSRYKLEVDDLTAYAYGGNTYIDLIVPSNGGTGTPLKTNQADQNTCQFQGTATYRVP